ncbi:hypothetical protein GAGA_1032 [Paraglaciecola agarilytica NO2]|uniref:Uncharacterized protein n=1 Tax=Paraglaciecola agarilytica NO2 TaxID=1125747 RepID=A0ABQ0I3I7_9ALTE|nr:hypothetical protein GAGA_1032 [Paraglaciecola agarilytica NO2]
MAYVFSPHFLYVKTTKIIFTYLHLVNNKLFTILDDPFILFLAGLETPKWVGMFIYPCW